MALNSAARLDCRQQKLLRHVPSQATFDDHHAPVARCARAGCGLLKATRGDVPQELRAVVELRADRVGPAERLGLHLGVGDGVHDNAGQRPGGS